MRNTFLCSSNLVAKAAIVCVVLFFFVGHADASRIKELTEVKGVRTNQLVGYGLVVGLSGTGDGKNSQFTFQSLASLLERMGVTVDPKNVEKIQNVAAVMVTADLSAFAKVGSKLDVTVSSIGDASSLTGGTLLVTPLKGADGKVYAVAQGAVSTGGYAVSGKAAKVSKNFPTVGRVVGGGIIENEIPYAFVKNGALSLSLSNPDFTNAIRIVKSINSALKGRLARALDAGTIEVEIPQEYSGYTIELVAMIEQLDIDPDKSSKVVINERTGTVVIGENVRISTVAIAHGNLSIEIKENQDVSQPMPFAPAAAQGAGPTTSADGSAITAPGGNTVVTSDTNVSVQEEKSKLFLVKRSVTIADVVRGLNALGVSPRDLMTIFQALRAAGALEAELEVM
jgi:flagellar P-ring protein precursor FlgI